MNLKYRRAETAIEPNSTTLKLLREKLYAGQKPGSTLFFIFLPREERKDGRGVIPRRTAPQVYPSGAPQAIAIRQELSEKESPSCR
ncbi:hypothetical protein LRN56_14690, partial [Staphylococcus aureus]|nr:hypothetical protein [Staphylococcus aureus]